MSKDLKDKTLDELEAVVTGLGQKKYLAGYIFKFIHVHVRQGGHTGYRGHVRFPLHAWNRPAAGRRIHCKM